MAFLLCWKNIAGGKLQQGDRDRCAPRACRAAATPVLVGSRIWKCRSRKTVRWSAWSNSKNYCTPWLSTLRKS